MSSFINIRKKSLLMENLLTIIFCFTSFFAAYNNNLYLSFVTVIIVIYFVLKKRNSFIGLYISVSAFSHFYLLNFFSVSETLNRMMTFLAILLLVPYINKIRKIDVTVYIPIFILCTVPLISILYYQTGLVSTLYLNIIIFFLFYNLPKDILNIEEIKKTILIHAYISPILITIMISINPYIGNVNSDRVSINSIVNPNRMAIALVAYSIVVLYTSLNQRKLLYKLFFLIPYFMSIYSIVMTGSRNSLLVLIIVSLLMWYKSLTNKIRFVPIITNVAIILIIGIFLMNYISEISNFERFNLSSLLEDGGSGRLDSIIISLNEVIPNNFLFGIGLGGQEYYLNQLGYMNVAASHNIVISTFAEMGLYGFVGFWILVGKTFKFSITSHQSFNILMYLLIGFIILGIGETIYSERIIWILMGIILSFNYSKNSYEIEKNKKVLE